MLNTATIEGFRAKTREILGKDFGTSVPQTTRRSGGLDVQNGILIGVTPDKDVIARISNTLLKDLRLVGGLSVYDDRSLHITLGDTRLVAGTQDLTEEQRMVLVTMENIVRDMPLDFGDLSLGKGKLMMSGDTIILVSSFSNEMYELRQQIIDLAEKASITIRPAWGSHLTLARLRAELTLERADALNALFAKYEDGIDLFDVAQLLVSDFVADGKDFWLRSIPTRQL